MGKAAGESDFKIGTLPSLPDCIYIRDRTEMTTNRILDSLRMQAPLLSMTLPPLSKLENMIPNLSYMSIGESASRVRHFLTDSSPLHDIVLGRAKLEADKIATLDWHNTCQMLGVPDFVLFFVLVHVLVV